MEPSQQAPPTQPRAPRWGGAARWAGRRSTGWRTTARRRAGRSQAPEPVAIRRGVPGTGRGWPFLADRALSALGIIRSGTSPLGQARKSVRLPAPGVPNAMHHQFRAKAMAWSGVSSAPPRAQPCQAGSAAKRSGGGGDDDEFHSHWVQQACRAKNYFRGGGNERQLHRPTLRGSGTGAIRRQQRRRPPRRGSRPGQRWCPARASTDATLEEHSSSC